MSKTPKGAHSSQAIINEMKSELIRRLSAMSRLMKQENLTTLDRSELESEINHIQKNLQTLISLETLIGEETKGKDKEETLDFNAARQEIMDKISKFNASK